MITKCQSRPACFGDLQKVFPLCADGLRATPPECMACAYKTPCLRVAMTRKAGLKVREEAVDRAYASGMMGFFERWSRKKSIQRRLTHKPKK